MDLEALSNKQLNEVERLAKELEIVLKRAKLQDDFHSPVAQCTRRRSQKNTLRTI
jgi:hypothetical protein